MGTAITATAIAGKKALQAANLKKGGHDFSPKTGTERQAVPTACWSCVTRDSMIGFVENGKLVKLEGHPKSIRGMGKICSKGQAGINQLYDPKAKPKYYTYKKEVKAKDLKKDGVIFDDAAGVYWNWKKSKAKNETE